MAFLVYAPSTARNFPRLYWRGRVYDHFEDARWTTSDVEGKNYEPQNGDFESPDTENREKINFTYNVYIKGQTILYTAAQPVWVSHPANIAHTKIPAIKEDEGDVMDIVTLQASPYLEAGESYHSTACLPTQPSLNCRKRAGVSRMGHGKIPATTCRFLPAYPGACIGNYHCLPQPLR